MLYLASPYTHPDEDVRTARYKAVCQKCAELLRGGTFVFSPIAHSHGIAAFGLPGDWDFWRRYDRQMIALCPSFGVLKLDGWLKSVGVAAELGIAMELHKPILYLEPASHPEV